MYGTRNQVVLPLNLETKIKGDDPVFKLAEICDMLDYTELYKAYVRTYRKYDPAMLFMLLVFAYMNGIYSSREIEKACRNDIRFMWILQNSPVPDHATIAHFQNERLSAVMENLFYQLVLKLSELGEVEFKNVFVDGTKIEANANRYTFVWANAVQKNMNRLYDRIDRELPGIALKYGLSESAELEVVIQYLENFARTDVSVGHSKYRIDIGVIDPNDTEKYILGILLDGDCYEEAKTTRDREIAQINVLDGLGWNIMRVWSMDWWDNRQKEVNRIISGVKDLYNGVDEQIDDLQAEAALPSELSDIMSADICSMAESMNDERIGVYKAAVLNNPYLSSDEFISGRHNNEIARSVLTVMLAEAPVSYGTLTRRVVQSFGIARSGSRIQEHMNLIYSALKLNYTIQNGEKIYWNDGQSPESYVLIRKTGEGNDKRDAGDIPIAEAVNAVIYILEQQISLSEDDLIRETAKLMGYTRMGNIVVSLFKEAVLQANKQNRIRLSNNNRFVLSK